MEAISFAVQLEGGADGWLADVERAEAGGFEAACVSDHPGLTVSPFVALAAAAPATSTIALGTAVLNAGVRGPLEIAADVATLDLVSGGRALLGLGAGHTPSEWTAIGLTPPSPQQRVERLGAVLAAVRRLLAGEAVDADGPGFALRGARLAFAPQREIPLLVGGNGAAVVRLGARTADVVEIGGLGRTLPDGHFHEVRWRGDQIDRVVSAFHEAAGGRRPRLGALVQHVAVTDDPEGVAARFVDVAAGHLPADTVPTVADVLAAPFALIGSVPEIVRKLRELRSRWGFDRYTVRAAALDDVVRIRQEATDATISAAATTSFGARS